MNHEAHILETWHQNARQWIKVIAEDGIDSRKRVTNDAIVDAIENLKPQKVWDIGCGEGWLCTRLTAKGISCMGTDAIATLIEAAKQAGNSYFEVLSYRDITKERVKEFGADTFVFNFSLFGKEEVTVLLKTLAQSAVQNAHLVIQTLHPYNAPGNEWYESGWREGSWSGIGDDFVNPAPWYFRTMGAWVSLFQHTGFSLLKISEPLHPDTGKPASAIFICRKA